MNAVKTHSRVKCQNTITRKAYASGQPIQALDLSDIIDREIGPSMVPCQSNPTVSIIQNVTAVGVSELRANNTIQLCPILPSQ